MFFCAKKRVSKHGLYFRLGNPGTFQQEYHKIYPVLNLSIIQNLR